jgi:hypothetical protein
MSNVVHRLRVFANGAMDNVHTEGRVSNRRMEELA